MKKQNKAQKLNTNKTDKLAFIFKQNTQTTQLNKNPYYCTN